MALVPHRCIPKTTISLGRAGRTVCISGVNSAVHFSKVLVSWLLQSAPAVSAEFPSTYLLGREIAPLALEVAFP